MLNWIHLILVVIYIAVPAGVLVHALTGSAGEQGTRRPRLASLIMTMAAAAVVGVTICMVYAKALRGSASISQMLLAGYFALGLLLILRGIDSGLRLGLRRIFGLHKADPAMSFKRALGALAVSVLWLGLLIAIGLPYVVAASLTYRPRIINSQTPLQHFGMQYTAVSFETADHLRLAGWWIPASEENANPAASGKSDQWDGWGHQTAIVCHDLFGSKSDMLPMARRLVDGGFNVLLFDFRAHGQSAGQLSGFGALEQRDVLAAVKWVRTNHAEESTRICGVGAGMGADALISAATQPHSDGAAIDALAVYTPYDDPPDMIREMSWQYLEPPIGWLVRRIGLPIASLHAGVDLVHYSPVSQVSRFWPRPILFIHGVQDEVIPFPRGRAVYEAADQPKYYLWFQQGSHRQIMKNTTASAVVLEFFRTAHAVPVI